MMAEKTAPATIWACMEGPMVGLFVSGGYTAGWPKYTRADSHDKLVEALKAAAASAGFQYMLPEVREKIDAALSRHGEGK